MFERNSLPSICSDILAASLPFITLGLLGNLLVLHISIIVGVLALLGLVLSILLKNHTPSYKSAIILPQDFSLPYAFALSSTILQTYGIDATIGLWFSLFLCILVICNAFLFRRQRQA